MSNTNPKNRLKDIKLHVEYIIRVKGLLGLMSEVDYELEKIVPIFVDLFNITNKELNQLDDYFYNIKMQCRIILREIIRSVYEDVPMNNLNDE